LPLAGDDDNHKGPQCLAMRNDRDPRGGTMGKTGLVTPFSKFASEAQLNAIFGWGENSNESRRYTRAARQKVLAASAITLLSTESGTATVPFASPGTETCKKAKEIK